MLRHGDVIESVTTARPATICGTGRRPWRAVAAMLPSPLLAAEAARRELGPGGGGRVGRPNPQLLVVDTITPIMFVLLFAFVFGGAIKTPGSNYVTFPDAGHLRPDSRLRRDRHRDRAGRGLQKGHHRPVPLAPDGASGVLIGTDVSRTSCRNAYTVAVMTVGRLPDRLRFTAPSRSSCLPYVLVTLFGYSISWLSANIGLAGKVAQAAQGAIFIPVFPLTFASSAFVPVARCRTGCARSPRRTP